MITIKNKTKAGMLSLITAGVLFVSCNKNVKQFADTLPVYPLSTGSIAKTIAATPTDSLYYRMIVRAGMVSTLNDSSRNYTMFITDNNGMKIFVNAASGGLIPLAAPDATFSAFIANTLPVASAAGVIQYNTVAQTYPSASIPATFPNTPLPSQIILDPVNQFAHMQICPVKSTPYAYVNNIPFISFDQTATNGIIHHMYTVVSPPSAVLKSMIASESTLTYFRAAIARADSGQVGLNRFDSLMNYGLTNMTILAPNDAAFQALIFNLVYTQTLAATGSVAIATATANGAVAVGPAFLNTNNVSSALVRGIIAYHFLATNTTSGYQPNIRVFSTDIPAATATPFFIKTLVNTSIVSHPGVIAITAFTGPAVTSLKFSGVDSLSHPTGAPVTSISTDKHAVNGVYHIINGVLLPQLP